MRKNMKRRGEKQREKRPERREENKTKDSEGKNLSPTRGPNSVNPAYKPEVRMRDKG